MIKLLNTIIAITPIFDSDYSAGTFGSPIIIPEQAKSRCKQGIVKYIGPEVKDVKILDYVFFSAYSGTVFRLEDEGVLILMKEESITAVFDSSIHSEIPGLYFVDKENNKFPATFEMAMNLISSALGQSQFFRDMKVKEYYVSEKNTSGNKIQLESEKK